MYRVFNPFPVGGTDTLPSGNAGNVGPTRYSNDTTFFRHMSNVFQRQTQRPPTSHKLKHGVLAGRLINVAKPNTPRGVLGFRRILIILGFWLIFEGHFCVPTQPAVLISTHVTECSKRKPRQDLSISQLLALDFDLLL